jgi:hypothetical protein
MARCEEAFPRVEGVAPPLEGAFTEAQELQSVANMAIFRRLRPSVWHNMASSNAKILKIDDASLTS